MAKLYLELTKLQRHLVFDMIRNQGYSEGVHALYQRLKRVFGEMIHPAMNNRGEIAYKNQAGKFTNWKLEMKIRMNTTATNTSTKLEK